MAGVEENGWGDQLNMTLDPVYHLIDAGAATLDARNRGDFYQVGQGVVHVQVAVIETALIVAPGAGLAISGGVKIAALASRTATTITAARTVAASRAAGLATDAGAVQLPGRAAAATLDDLARIGSQAGERTVLAPGGGLVAHEAAGGHTLLKHVGRTEAQLVQRLVDEPWVGASSTFTSRTAAELWVARAIDANAAKITDWLATGPTKPMPFTMSGNGVPTGVTVPRGAVAIQAATGVRVVLVADSTVPLGYRILTAYPE